MSIEKVDNSIEFMTIFQKISYPEIDALNANKYEYDYDSIINIFLSVNKKQFSLTLTTGIIKIYDAKTFELIFNIDFKEDYKKMFKNYNK